MPASKETPFMRAAVVLLLLLPIPATADDATRTHAEAFWKTNVRKAQGKLGNYATENVLVVGSAEARTLESVGKAAERAVAFAKKSVGFDEKPIKRENAPMYDRANRWSGKLIVFVCKERQEFADLFTQMKSGRPGGSECSAYFHDKDHSYVLVGPSAASGRKVAPELEAVQMAGVATLTRRHEPVPAWLTTGFGRMLAYKYDPKAFAAERKRIPLWAGKLHVRDLMVSETSKVPYEALAPLQASVVECLSQSPAFQDEWFKLLDETAYRGGSLEAAMSEKKLPLDDLQAAWKTWLAKLQ
jgi:hypothetical protein